jgi:predicted porin
MKKSLIALAVLAASGAAMAQSSVTIYGIADVWIGQTETTAATLNAPKVKQTVVNSSGHNNSRWGLKGSEDLGGGLMANFVLESGFNTDTGALAGDLFGRKATVGVSGGFGAVNLGRDYTAYDSLRSATNNTYDSNFATTATVWNNGVRDYTLRTSNSIRYDSPSFGGISGAVAYAFGENKNVVTTNALTNNAAGKATDVVSLHIKYANGPVLVGYAFQEEKKVQASALVGQDKIQYNLIAASYDLGMAKLTGGYNQAKQGNIKDDEYQLGVSVPFGAASVALGYAASKSDINGLNGNKGTGISLLGTYDLSKRTRLYAGLNSTKVEAISLTSDSYKATTAGVGVKHSF